MTTSMRIITPTIGPMAHMNPVQAELEGQHDPRDDAEGERDGEDLPPEAEHAQPQCPRRSACVHRVADDQKALVPTGTAGKVI